MQKTIVLGVTGGIAAFKAAQLASDLIKKMELFGSDAKGLYMLDQELAARTYAAPSLTL